MKNKVLVCITIQENSRRLISEGFNLSKILNAPLHILHIRKGETVFDNADSSKLLEDLFAYGSELGGEVHFLCSKNIPQTIANFILTNKITDVVIGETPENMPITEPLNIFDELTEKLTHININVIPRQENTKLDA